MPNTRPATFKPASRDHVFCTRTTLEEIKRITRSTHRLKISGSDWLHEAIMEKLEREEA